MEDLNIYQKPTKYEQAMFCEAVNSLSAKSILAGEKLVAMYSIST